MDDSSDEYRHSVTPERDHTWPLTGYDALQFIRSSEPWKWNAAVEELECFYCGEFSFDMHADTCVWKRAQRD
jgi:hypothetical protein